MKTSQIVGLLIAVLLLSNGFTYFIATKGAMNIVEAKKTEATADSVKTEQKTMASLRVQVDTLLTSVKTMQEAMKTDAAQRDTLAAKNAALQLRLDAALAALPKAKQDSISRLQPPPAAIRPTVPAQKPAATPAANHSTTH